MKKYLASLADKILDWTYDNGYVDQLATLATNSAGVRGIILSAASALTAQGIIKHSISESIISLLVIVISMTLASFVQYARNKHAKEVQKAVGTIPDNFIGKDTVDAVKTVVAVANQS